MTQLPSWCRGWTESNKTQSWAAWCEARCQRSRSYTAASWASRGRKKLLADFDSAADRGRALVSSGTQTPPPGINQSLPEPIGCTAELIVDIAVGVICRFRNQHD